MACALLRPYTFRMTTLVKGIHHVTLCPARAQDDLDFCSQVLGQRLVKQTVLMDGRIPIYHFYWGSGRRRDRLHCDVVSVRPEARTRLVRDR